METISPENLVNWIEKFLVLSRTPKKVASLILWCQKNDWNDRLNTLIDHWKIAENILLLHIFWERPVEICNSIIESLEQVQNEWDRIEIAKKVAIENGRRVAEYFDLYRIEEQGAIKDIAILCTYNHPRRTAFHFKNFQLLKEDDRYMAWLTAAFSGGLWMSQFIDNFWIEDLELRKQIFSLALRNDPGIINLINYYFPDSGITWPGFNLTIPDIKKWLLLTSGKIPSTIPPTTSKIYSEVKRRDVWLRLLSGYILSETVSNDEESIELLTWFPTRVLFEAKMSNDVIGDFYEILLDLQTKYFFPFFSKIKIDFDLFQNKENAILFKRCLNLLNLISQLQDSRASLQYEQLVSIMNSEESSNINERNIRQIIDELQVMFERELLMKIGENCKYFDPKKLDDLAELWWGDIRVVATLVARYNGKSSWKKAIPILIKIIDVVLADKFREFKYFWFGIEWAEKDKLTGQTSFLSDNQIQEWAKNPSSLEAIKDNSNNSSQIWLEDAKEEILIWINYLEKIKPDFNYHDIPSFISLNDKQTIKILKETYSNDANKMLLHMLYLLQHENSVDNLKQLMSRVKSIKDILKIDSFWFDLLNKISGFLYPKAPKRKKEVLFTTFFDHPKLTLSIGNLVKTPSCYNYNNGTEAQALIAAAVDANIKWIMSFVITVSSFWNEKDFNSFYNSVLAGEEVECKVSNSWKELEIKIWENITRIALPDAYYRQIVKLGKTNEWSAWIRWEQAYCQTHSEMDFIKQKALILLKIMAQKISASTEEEIYIPASRSPCPTYSDYAGGRQEWPYTIPKLLS